MLAREQVSLSSAIAALGSLQQSVERDTRSTELGDLSGRLSLPLCAKLNWIVPGGVSCAGSHTGPSQSSASGAEATVPRDRVQAAPDPPVLKQTPPGLEGLPSAKDSALVEACSDHLFVVPG